MGDKQLPPLPQPLLVNSVTWTSSATIPNSSSCAKSSSNSLKCSSPFFSSSALVIPCWLSVLPHTPMSFSSFLARMVVTTMFLSRLALKQSQSQRKSGTPLSAYVLPNLPFYEDNLTFSSYAALASTAHRPSRLISLATRTRSLPPTSFLISPTTRTTLRHRG